MTKRVKTLIDDGYSDEVRQLRAIRESKNMSQKELDHIIGVTDGVVSKWENRHRLPQSYLFSCWVQALGGKLVIEVEDKKTTE